jgi:hypothetical protein
MSPIMSRIAIVIATALAFAVALSAAPAQAQRVFVAATGSDNNPCTFASPCRSFQHAHDVASSGGEIDVLDPAGYGAVTIKKAISIQGHGFSGISVASGVSGITINAGPFDAITLSGLIIDGAGAGANGIVFAAGGYLIVQDCMIHNMTGDGIHFVPNSISHISVANTFVGNNGGNGILVQPVGSASVDAVFERVRAQYNGQNAWGISLDADLTGGTVSGTATDTVSSYNGGGFLAEGAAATLTVMRSVAANNQTGLAGNGQTKLGAIFMGQTTITNNGLGCEGYINTFLDNYSINNTSDGCDLSSNKAKE